MVNLRKSEGLKSDPKDWLTEENPGYSNSFTENNILNTDSTLCRCWILGNTDNINTLLVLVVGEGPSTFYYGKKNVIFFFFNKKKI